MQKNSLYSDLPIDQWAAVTEKLVSQHPLGLTEILEIAQSSWESVWSTKIGSPPTQLDLRDVNPPATVIGYFFEKIFAKKLADKYPGVWRGGLSGDEKDLHNDSDPNISVEIKASGQLGTKIFGNRSYGQKVENESLAKKDKSGYYITVNFYGEQLNLVRFGWIDSSDWKAQAAATGQMAGLPDEVYKHKLIALKGAYTLKAPISLLPGVGPKLQDLCHAANVFNIEQALSLVPEKNPDLKRAISSAKKYKSEFSN